MLTANVQRHPPRGPASIIDGNTRVIASIQILRFLNLQEAQERIHNEESRWPQFKIS